MAKIVKAPAIMSTKVNSFCAGCGHGIITRILAEAVEEMGLSEKTILCIGIGCYCSIGSLLKVDSLDSPHGRAPAVATGIKRMRPENIVITYQGAGDISSIGCGEIVHAAARNEKITSIFVNNGVYGMTGGQMAPTTLPHQVTATTANGRDPEVSGMPIKLSEMLSVFPVAYIARGSVHRAGEILKTKAYIKKALQAQIDGKGFSMIEILSPCPTNWHMSPAAAADRIDAEVIPYYPLGELVKKEGE